MAEHAPVVDRPTTVAALVLLLFLLAGARWCRAEVFADAGFAGETIATLPPFTPVGLAFAPDGRMFVWQKQGIVHVVKQGVLLPQPFIDISSQVNQYGDRGLLGLAVDPNFAETRAVYLLYAVET